MADPKPEKISPEAVIEWFRQLDPAAQKKFVKEFEYELAMTDHAYQQTLLRKLDEKG